MTYTNEFKQAVMAAASVPITQCEYGHDVQDHLKANETSKLHGRFCMEYPCDCESYARATAVYPDPLTAEGFDALWECLERTRHRITITSHSVRDGYTVKINRFDADGFPFSHFKSTTEESGGRKAALLEAAAQALGVSR